MKHLRPSLPRSGWLASGCSPCAASVLPLLLLVTTPAAAEEPPPPATSRPGSRAADTSPPVDALCRAAVAMALAEPERARSFVSRARIAGWLPELHFRVFRRFAR